MNTLILLAGGHTTLSKKDPERVFEVWQQADESDGYVGVHDDDSDEGGVVYLNPDHIVGIVGVKRD